MDQGEYEAEYGERVDLGCGQLDVGAVRASPYDEAVQCRYESRVEKVDVGHLVLIRVTHGQLGDPSYQDRRE